MQRRGEAVGVVVMMGRAGAVQSVKAPPPDPVTKPIIGYGLLIQNDRTVVSQVFCRACVFSATTRAPQVSNTLSDLRKAEQQH